jgi:hypothetical protein
VIVPKMLERHVDSGIEKVFKTKNIFPILTRRPVGAGLIVLVK